MRKLTQDEKDAMMIYGFVIVLGLMLVLIWPITPGGSILIQWLNK